MAHTVGGVAVVYALGVPVLAAQTQVSINRALAISAVYLPGDAVKVVLASVVTAAVVRGYPRVLAQDR